MILFFPNVQKSWRQLLCRLIIGHCDLRWGIPLNIKIQKSQIQCIKTAVKDHSHKRVTWCDEQTSKRQDVVAFVKVEAANKKHWRMQKMRSGINLLGHYSRQHALLSIDQSHTLPNQRQLDTHLARLKIDCGNCESPTSCSKFFYYSTKYSPF